MNAAQQSNRQKKSALNSEFKTPEREDDEKGPYNGSDCAEDPGCYDRDDGWILGDRMA